MNKLYPIIIAVIFITNLSGCASSIPTLDKYNDAEFQTGSKAVVFIQVSEGNNPEEATPLHYTLSKLQKIPNEYSVVSTRTFYFKHTDINYANSMMMLDPGIYYINHVTLLSSFYNNHWFSSPGLHHNTILYGAFEVKAGDVASIGKLVIPYNMCLPFNKYNDIERVKKDLKKAGYIDLANKVQDHPFYNSGSTYIENQQGKYKLTSITEQYKHTKKIAHHRKKLMEAIEEMRIRNVKQ